MDSQKVDSFVLANGKYFKECDLMMLKNDLLNADDAKWNIISVMNFKSPTTAIILSLLVGVLGIDRFYLGKVGTGILKLITGGGLGIWYVIDWFCIIGMTKKANYSKVKVLL